MEGRRKKSWERAGIFLILGSMGAGFFYTLLVLWRTPETRTVSAPASAGAIAGDTNAPSVRPVEPRRYRRTLSVYDMQDMGNSSPTKGNKADTFGVLVPDVPESARTSPGMDLPNYPMPAASRPARRSDQDQEKEEEDKISTGWGWLADDIAANREEKKVAEEEALADEDADQRAAAPQRKPDGEPLLFMDQSFQSAGSDEVLRSPLREQKERWRENGQAHGGTDTGEEEEGSRPFGAGRDDAARGTLARETFALDGTPAFREADRGSWSSGRGPVDLFRENENRAADAAENLSPSRAGQITDPAAAGNFSRPGSLAGTRGESYGSLPSSYYASDHVFNSGGGYTPLGVESRGSDSLFSGEDVFRGGSLGSAWTPTAPSGANASPSLPGLSPGSLPSGSSLNGGHGMDAGQSTPKTLPW